MFRSVLFSLLDRRRFLEPSLTADLASSLSSYLSLERGGGLEGGDDDDFGVAVEDAISEKPRGSSGPSKRGRGGASGTDGKSRMPRSARDSKFGFGGGGKRREKQNTRESTNDFESGGGGGRDGRRGSFSGGRGRGGGGGGRGGGRGGRGGSTQRYVSFSLSHMSRTGSGSTSFDFDLVRPFTSLLIDWTDLPLLSCLSLSSPGKSRRQSGRS